MRCDGWLQADRTRKYDHKKGYGYMPCIVYVAVFKHLDYTKCSIGHFFDFVM